MVMSGNQGGLSQLTQQMQQLQSMQMNLQTQMGVGSSQQEVTGGGGMDDDNSFLNEDLPNLAAQISNINDNNRNYPIAQVHENNGL